MTEFSIRERVRLSRVRRELERGERDEQICEPLERAHLEFTEWRLRQGLDCTCGRSDGERCYCEDDYGPFNYG